jgi:hypothetical protein
MRMSDRREQQDPVEQDILHEVNAHVHEAALRFEDAGPAREQWEFTCECGASDCRVPVSLTLAEYEALRAADRPVLAPGHEKVAGPSSAT